MEEHDIEVIDERGMVMKNTGCPRMISIVFQKNIKTISQ